MKYTRKTKNIANESVFIPLNTKILLMILSLTLLTPFLWGEMFTDHEQRSKVEKRILSPLPKLLEIVDTKSYFNNLANYLRDHIGFGLEINQLYQQTMFKYFETIGVENISMGYDDFVFLTSHNPKKHNTIFPSLCFHDKNPKSIVTSATRLSNFTKNAGHNIIFAVAISKPTLYPDKLPKDVSNKVQEACTSFLKNKNFLVNAKKILGNKGIIMHYPIKTFLNYKDREAFYPKENFHWDGSSAHVFAKTLFKALGAKKSSMEKFDNDAEIKIKLADLKIIGFDRKIKTYDYPYSFYKVSNNQRKKLYEIKKYYDKAIDFSFYTTKNSIFNKDAILISNSFGAFFAKHLAPGYKSVTHININHLKSKEYDLFFNYLYNLGKKMDIIFLFHDHAMAIGKLEKIEKNLNLE